MIQLTPSLLRRRNRLLVIIALAGLSSINLYSCGFDRDSPTVMPPVEQAPETSPATSPGRAVWPSSTGPADGTTSPSATPANQTISSDLQAYGITILAESELSDNQRAAIQTAAGALAGKVSQLFPGSVRDRPDRYEAFRDLFGPTTIAVLEYQWTVDGVHYGLNCGWEGRYAEGCKDKSIFPEQQFPTRAWLILLAGHYTDASPERDTVALVTHELVHNLTWGEGNHPSKVNGFSYVRYVGDLFAIKYMDYLGVQIGRDAYVDEQARSAHPLWRAELTADAVASWALDAINGPYAPIINHYIHDMMVCVILGGPLC